MNTDIMTIREVAAYLKLTEKTAYRLAAEGKIHHARYVTFQMAEVAVPRVLFEQILARIARLTPVVDTG